MTNEQLERAKTLQAEIQGCASCAYHVSDIYFGCVCCECIHEEHHHVLVPSDEAQGCSDWKKKSGKSIYECMKPEAFEYLLESTIQTGIEAVGNEQMKSIDDSIGIKKTIVHFFDRQDIGSVEHSYLYFDNNWFTEKEFAEL